MAPHQDDTVDNKPIANTQAVDSFVQRWSAASGSERANYQLFLTELTELLGEGRPDPASQDTEENAYVFERKVVFCNPDGSSNNGFIDLYRRGCFVCEAKQTNKTLDTKGWDNAMIRAHGQAQQYARALPAAEGRPPFIIVVDVGRNIELYSEFTRSGASYVPFPDPRSHRIRLDDLHKPEVQHILKAIWADPLSLDPARRSARVTREIAAHLAKLAKSLEQAGHPADTVAAYLMRALFTMFAEDVGLLKNHSFTGLLEKYRNQPDNLPHVLTQVWQEMNSGSAFSPALEQRILRFNGGLFADPAALPLDKHQIDLLIEAARADWRHVEPSIFGTLLERALDPTERHRLGAHYTPRAYVERLVMPTVIEPLREDWATAQATALLLDREGKRDKAVAELQAFHHQLCKVRVLDPACGSGNFLYVTLEHLKRLEGEVLNTLEELGHTQGKLEMAGVTVDPHQMLGLETNPRAARIAEAVLWIGYLQWHFKTRGNVNPPEPVLKDFHNIECRDAVLAWDDIEYVLDEQGRPVTRWDGVTTKQHPVTGEDVPDERAVVPTERYINSRKAEWPAADYVVGNPPFIGNKRMRSSLGDGYVEAVRSAYDDMAGAADYVMYWWYHAADLVANGKLGRFGFITTNSLTQTFNRQVVQTYLDAKSPLSLLYAIPDHPWVDSSDGAAVRIAMTVAGAGQLPGRLARSIAEHEGDGEGVDVELAITTGRIFPDLKIGPNLTACQALSANLGIAFTGMYPLGQGFVLLPEDVAAAVGNDHQSEAVVKPFVIARDLTQKSRQAQIIDFYPRAMEQVRADYPSLYQWVHDRVKPERDHNPRKVRKERWWLFAEPNPSLRKATNGLERIIAIPRTAKWFSFQFVPADTRPDTSVVAIASDDAYLLGVLSSRLHLNWAVANGGTLEDRPRYQHQRTFNPFPFPAITEAQQARIRDLAEQLDAHRKRQQALHPDLTLTGMYNVLEKRRRGEPLIPKDKTIHEQGLVSVLAQLHDELDAAVLDAYGWSDLAPALVGKPGGTTPYPDKPAAQAEAEEELLSRLVILNTQRAAEEAKGLIRWLRPDYQNPGGEQTSQDDMAGIAPAEAATGKAGKHPWPRTLPEQVQSLRRVLAEQPAPVSAEQLARQFSRAQTRKISELLQTLSDLGQVREQAGSYSAA